MRFCLKLILNKDTLPVEYRKIIISYIKNAVSKCNNGKYYEEFFKDTNQKDYCFSAILPKSIFNKDEIKLENKEIKIKFSVDDNSKAGLILYSAFIAQKNKEYPLPNNNFMILENIFNIKQEKIINSKVVFNTAIGSSLCVRDHNKIENKDKYYIYSDSEFREKLNIVLRNQLIKKGFIEDEINEVKVNPIQCKKVVVKHYKRYIDTTVGMFQMEGNLEILQYLYSSGIGSRKSAGFGMIELVTQDLI